MSNIFSDRVPLEHINNNSQYRGERTLVTDTPTSKNYSKSKMTTPPESVFTMRKKSISFETPLPKSNTSTTTAVSLSALLSPAFSSPNKAAKRKYLLSSPPPACINPSTSSLSLSSEDAGGETVKAFAEAPKKKTKKPKKESKETSFDLDSEDKPPYSYATLIGISILSHPDKRLPLSQIYQWISDTFKYYKREDVGWQNSIRHNLSLNKAFVKGEKSKDGKGHFWCIKEGHEEQFLKSRSVKKSSYHEVMDQINLANSKYRSLREETKRNMNAIPSSPNVPSAKRRKHDDNDNDNHDEDNDDDDDDNEYSYTYNDTNEDDEDDGDITHILDPPLKKRRLDALGEPFGQWDPSTTPAKTPNTNQHPPQFLVSESPNKPLLAGKNLTYTSSFSCNSNLELSPIRPSETGPLLEPLTPANNIYHQHFINTTTQNTLPPLLSNHLSSLHPHLAHKFPNGSSLQRTPKSNALRTPLRNLRTPQTNSIMRKLWNSPSYLEEFYYSPLVNNNILNHHSSVTHAILNSYDDDDMILRNFDHPHNQSPVLSKKSNSVSTIDSSRNLFNDFKKADLSSESSTEGNHSRSDSSTTESD